MEDLAAEQIFILAKVVTDAQFRGAAADALDALDHSDQAAEVTDWLAAGQAPQDGETSDDWTELCLSHALGSNVRRMATSGDAGDSGVPAPSDANGEDTSEGNPEPVEEVQAKADGSADGQDLSEEIQT